MSRLGAPLKAVSIEEDDLAWDRPEGWLKGFAAGDVIAVAVDAGATRVGRGSSARCPRSSNWPRAMDAASGDSLLAATSRRRTLSTRRRSGGVHAARRPARGDQQALVDRQLEQEIYQSRGINDGQIPPPPSSRSCRRASTALPGGTPTHGWTPASAPRTLEEARRSWSPPATGIPTTTAQR